MTDAVDASGVLIPVSIPQYTESADIQKALRIYHYGPDYVPSNSDATPLTSPSSSSYNSIAGYLHRLKVSVDALGTAGIVLLGSDEDLNTKTTTGLYHQDSGTQANSINAAHYPTVNGTAFPGLLTVTISESYVYQTYQMFGNATTVSNLLWFRTRDNNATWTAWKQVSDSTHTHPNYVTTTDFSTALGLKQNVITGPLSNILTTPDLTASAAVVTDANGKIIASATISVAELNTLNTIDTTQTLKQQIDGKASTAHAATHGDGASDAITVAQSQVSGLATTLAQKAALDGAGTTLANRDPFRKNIGIFVQSGTPSGATTGDLWFW